MTTTYAGITCALKNERLSAEGKIEKEYIGTLDGSGANQTLYTKRFPITTSAGVTTDAETEVDVFTDDGSEGSWSEYLDDGTDFVIDGSEGTVTIQAAENQAGNAGERISISYYTTEEPAFGQNVEIAHAQALTEIYKLGSENPQELKEGPITIDLSIGTFYGNRSMLGTILSVSDFYKKLSDYSFYLYPNKEVSGQPYIKLSNVKYSGGRLGVSIDGILALDVTAKGLAVEWGTVA